MLFLFLSLLLLLPVLSMLPPPRLGSGVWKPAPLLSVSVTHVACQLSPYSTCASSCSAPGLGAMLESHTAATPPPIKGSVLLAMATSAEEVLEQLRKDVYAAEVWDLEKVQIIPVSFLFYLPSEWCGCEGGGVRRAGRTRGR